MIKILTKPKKQVAKKIAKKICKSNENALEIWSDNKKWTPKIMKILWKFGSIRRRGKKRKRKMLWKIDQEEGEDNRLMKCFKSLN